MSAAGSRADGLIRSLDLVPHPEGGFYRETYRSGELVPAAALPKRYSGRRPFSTAIFFLLRSGQVSRLHRLRSDEVWHFYDGNPLRLHILSAAGRYSSPILGRDRKRGQRFQIVVPRGAWFGAEVAGKGSFSLIGCTIAPGFDFADFELGDRTDLLRRFPLHKKPIIRMTTP